MNRLFRRLILTAILVIYSTAVAFAQETIEKLVAKLEDNPKCETKLYRENRNPKTHKITSFEMIVEFNDDKIAERIINAFKNERKNSTGYIANDNGKNSRTNKLYNIEFKNNDGTYSTFTLSYSITSKRTSEREKGKNITYVGGKWTLIAKALYEKNKDKPEEPSHKKTRVKRSKTNGKYSSYAELPYDFEVYPDYLVTVNISVPSSIDIPTQSDIRY